MEVNISFYVNEELRPYVTKSYVFPLLQVPKIISLKIWSEQFFFYIHTTYQKLLESDILELVQILNFCLTFKPKMLTQLIIIIEKNACENNYSINQDI